MVLDDVVHPHTPRRWCLDPVAMLLIIIGVRPATLR